jgi:hypothetical protein
MRPIVLPVAQFTVEKRFILRGGKNTGEKLHSLLVTVFRQTFEFHAWISILAPDWPVYRLQAETA